MASSLLSRLDLWLYRTVLLLLLSSFSESVHVIPVFRLIQYTSVDSNLGSQRTGVNLLSGTWVPKESQDLSRRIVIIHYDQLNKESLDEILTEKKAGGVLVTLPNNETKRFDPNSLANWNVFEKHLISTEVKVPFYFTFEDEFLKQINSDVSQSSNTQELLHPLRDMYQLVVTSPEAPIIQEITGNNYRGWLTGARQPGQEQLQTLAVVASYDAIAAAPELAVGADSNASGLVALFELARLFSKLYTGYKTQGNYNLLFLVTGGGRQNSEGLKNWLASADSRLLDSIEFALCLDSILPPSGQQQGLYLHVSKSAKEEKFQQIVTPFNNTAKSLGIGFQVVHKKINISDPTIYWEHELFSRKRIFAATLSHLSSPSPSFKRSNILDRPQAGDVAVLEKNIKFIAESLSQQIYKTKRNEVEVFDGFLSVNSFFLTSWLSTLTSFPRFLPYIPSNSPLYSFIERVLKEYTTEVTVQNFKIENSDIKFYSSPANLTMSAYKVKPFTFDLLLFFLILAYLFSLFVSLKGISGAVASVKEFLSPSQSKKRR